MTATMPERPQSRLRTIIDERASDHSQRRRVETLHDMLNRYNEARSESAGAGGGGSRLETRVLSFDPTTWTREYQELERCLIRLRWISQHGRPIIERDVSSSAAWWHLRQRYLESTTVRREVVMRKTHSGNRVPAPLPRNMEVVARPSILHGSKQSLLVRVWDPRVDPQVVGAALRWVSREFRGEPAVYSEG